MPCESAWRQPCGNARPQGHPARGRSFVSRQVSWLAGLSLPSGLPGALTAPVTLSTKARRLQLRGQRRSCTGFPLSSRSCVSGDRDPYIWCAIRFLESRVDEGDSRKGVKSGEIATIRLVGGQGPVFALPRLWPITAYGYNPALGLDGDRPERPVAEKEERLASMRFGPKVFWQSLIRKALT